MSKKRKTQHARQTTQDDPQPPQPQAPKMSWIKLATETEPLCAIPVLHRFQADLPTCTGNCHDPESIKWLGERVWPLQEESYSAPTQDNNEELIGKGRPEICTCHSPRTGRAETHSCPSPGSTECVSRHVNEERHKLKTELGPAFEEWKFDQMGEVISSSWYPREEKKFEALVKRNLSENLSSVESSWTSFRDKDRKSLVSYYFNVYIPRKICRLTRSGCSEVHTDDDADDVPSNSQKLESQKLQSNNNSQKKENETSKSGKKGTKSDTAEDEASKARKSKSSEPQKKPANYAGKNKYLAGRR